MCGIVGIVDFSGRPIDQALARRMCGQLRHRGPDDQGLKWLPSGEGPPQARPTVVLGSQRLSIIDVRGGHQPMGNEDGTIWTVFNGEIYNFRKLRSELEQAGHRFATGSDTEVIVHLYEERGEEFVEALDGMFALAVWDDRNQRLLLARDRFGKKPLVYAQLGARVLFASEFQALLAEPALSREIDLEALDYYLTYMAIPAPLSIYRVIRKVPPAHVLVCDRGGVRLRRYWQLAYEPKLDMREAEAKATLRELLQAAVRKRLMSEVPLGVLLSGGVDSTAVVAVMAQLVGPGVKTFSIGFDDPRYNELPYAQRVARRYGCEHRAFRVTPRAAHVLPTLVEHFGEPFADSSAIPTYYLAQLTRPHVTVALNGDGGDEAFAGYGRHLANRMVEWWQRSPRPLRLPIEWLGERMRERPGPAGMPPSRLQRWLETSGLPRADRYRRWAGVFSGELKTGLVGTNGSVAEHGMVEQLFAQTGSLDAVDAALAVDTAFYLPTDLLVKMDISSMAHALEVRSPFLDRDLVEFVARLPSSFKLRGVVSKYLLKQALAGTVPRGMLHRRKQGFAVPIGQWLRGELRTMLCDHLLSSRLAACGLLQQTGLERLVKAHLEGQVDYGHHLWALLVLELWYRRFIEAYREIAT